MDEWIQIVAPAAQADAQAGFRAWEAANQDVRARLCDDDIRIDTMRATDGRTLVRYRIRIKTPGMP